MEAESIARLDGGTHETISNTRKHTQLGSKILIRTGMQFNRIYYKYYL